jgi:excisionase family DNA binding protein
MKEMVRVNGRWAPAAEVEADLIRAAGPERAAQMMKWARESGHTATTEAEMKAADTEIKAAVARMWDEVLGSRRHMPLSDTTPPVSPNAHILNAEAPAKSTIGHASESGVVDAADQTRRVTKEQERQPVHPGRATPSVPARPQDRQAADVGPSEPLISSTGKAEPEYLTAAQVADLLQVSSKSVYRWAAEDATMPVIRIGGVVRFPRQRLLRWLRNHEQGFGRGRRRLYEEETH